MNRKNLSISLFLFILISFINCYDDSIKQTYKVSMDITHVIPKINYNIKKTSSLRNENNTKYVNNYYDTIHKYTDIKQIAEKILLIDLIDFANVSKSCSNHFKDFLKASIKGDLWALRSNYIFLFYIIK
jgi:hypothetical protein